MERTTGLTILGAILLMAMLLVSPVSSQATATTFVSPIIRMTDLGTLGSAWNGGYSMAWGINDRGQVVGASRTALGDMVSSLVRTAAAVEPNRWAAVPVGLGNNTPLKAR